MGKVMCTRCSVTMLVQQTTTPLNGSDGFIDASSSEEC